MKTKYFLVGFMILTIFAFSGSVKAADYAAGVAEDDVLIWKIKTVDIAAYAELYDVDEEDIEDLFDLIYDTDDPVGIMWQRTITGIEDDEPVDDVTEITYDYWEATDDKADFDDDADIEDAVTYIMLDPDELPDDVTGFGWLIPTPVADYLEAVDWADDVEVSGTTITSTIDKDDIGTEEDVIYTTKYNNKGVVSSDKMTTEGGAVIMETVLMGGAIPGYELPILLGVAAVGTIGLVYIVMKKK